MALNFAVSPYNDDFDPSKNYHRILFKPGKSVQARELTQSQTILQDQISKFGLGIYEDGSRVSGGNISVDTKILTAKIEDTDDIEFYTGLFAVGSVSKFIAEVIQVDVLNNYVITKPVNSANFSEFSSGETINLYDTKAKAFAAIYETIAPNYIATLKTESIITRFVSGTYLSDTITIQTGNISTGDEIYIPTINLRSVVTQIIDDTTLKINSALTSDLINASAEIKSKSSVNALELNIDGGVWFTNGLFVSNPQSNIIPDPINAFPSVVIGFEVNEYIIDSYNDASLLDPAIGASNYQAPGADRYKVTLNLTVKSYVDLQSVGNLSNSKFIELARINNGVTEKVSNGPNFSAISDAIAKSVYDQSGNFIVNPFSLKIGDSIENSNTISGFISSGRAYVNGYPAEHIAPTKYTLEKARDNESVENIDVVSYYGSYVTAGIVSGGLANFMENEITNLHNVTSGSASPSNKIGTARIRNFAYNSGSGSGTEYNVFLTDIKLTSNTSTISNVKSIVSSTSGFYTDVVQNNGATILQDTNYNSLVFPLEQKNIKAISNVDYLSVKKYTATFANTGLSTQATITTGVANEDFVGGTSTPLDTMKRNYIIVLSDGTFVPMDNVSISVNNSGTSQATITLGFPYENYSGLASVSAAVSITGGTRKVKNLVEKYSIVVDASELNVPIDIGVSDVYKFHGIYPIGNTSTYLGGWSGSIVYSTNDSVFYDGNVYVASYSSLNSYPDSSPGVWTKVSNGITDFSTDNGQRDSFYDHGYITNKSGISQGLVVAVVDFFTHSGTGFCDVNSYVAPIEYSQIPNFTSQQSGVTYNLRDVIDFRPRRNDGVGISTFGASNIPQPFNNIFVNYSYYLSRIDKIAITPTGQFKTLKGISSYINPVEPVDVAEALTLFTIKYPAYTFNASEIIVTPTSLKRYTMKDIGLLDKRITNLEYYTSLSISENQVAGSDVVDETGQNILFKNGFLVDGFKGHGTGDVNNPDYAVSIDFNKKICRPMFTSNVVSYTVDTNQGTFSTVGKRNNLLAINDNIITFSYDQTPVITQKVASSAPPNNTNIGDFININPFNVVNFVGEVKLSPTSDVWYDTATKPTINVINEDQSAWTAAVNQTGHGTQWNDWNINWSGENVVDPNNQSEVSRDTLAISQAIVQKGLVGAVTNGPIQVSSSSQIVSNSIIPYCRRIPIQFEVNGMPPLTDLYVFLNGSIINHSVSPDASYIGSIWNIDILNQGAGYTDGNNRSIISITGTNESPAIATANVVGGKITTINIEEAGSGYVNLPTISVVTPEIPTTTAILSANTSGGRAMGAPLMTNVNGKAIGTIYIPNDSIFKIPAGTLLFEFSDQPYIDSSNGGYARATFYAQGTLQTVQSTVVSTRPPAYSVKPVIVVPPQVPTPTETTTTTTTTQVPVDTTPPTITITSNKSSLTEGQTATITFTLNENSTDFTSGDVLVSGGTLSSFSGSGSIYTAIFTPQTNSITTGSVSVSSGVFRDLAGNWNTNGASVNISIDTTPADSTPPTISITSDRYSLYEGQLALITFELSEDSTNFTLSDITVSGGTLSVFSGSGSVYAAVFTPTPNSNAGGNISVATNKFSDAAGNFNTSGASINITINTIPVDTTAPTIALSSDTYSLTTGQKALITFTLSEASTDFASGDVTVSGGTLSNFIGSGTSYTATFTPNTNSTTPGIISVASNKFSDAAGNWNADGSDVNNTVTITVNTVPADTTPPTIALVSDKTTLTAGQTATISFLLNEDSTDFTSGDVTVSGGTLSGFSGSGNYYTATFTPTDNVITTGSISVASNKFRDAAGNWNADGSDVNNTVNISINTTPIDSTPPAIAITSNRSSVGIGQTATITFTLSENSTDFTSGDVTVSGGTLTGFSGSGNYYTATFTPNTSSTTSGVISVASNKFRDAAGNWNVDGSDANNTLTISVDTIAPTLVISSDKYSLSVGQTATITFTLNENSTNFVFGDVSVSGGTLSNFTGSGRIYTAIFTPNPNSTTPGIINVADSRFSDAIGNPNVTDGVNTVNLITISINTIVVTTAAPKKVYWEADALSPSAANASLDEGIALIETFILERADLPSGITPKIASNVVLAGTVTTLYNSFVSSLKVLPTPSQIAAETLRVAVRVLQGGTIPNATNIVANNWETAYFKNEYKSNKTAITNTLGSTAASKQMALDFFTCLGGQDPLSQNFFVNSLSYPNGLFLSSVDLFFVTKDDYIPVCVRIRPTVNGYPDAKNDIPGSIVYKNPQDIIIPISGQEKSGIGSPTRFTFSHPVYLPPGEYAIMITSNSDKYFLYKSSKGGVEYGTKNVITSVSGANAGVGSLFKSQNASTWIPSSEGESLCFVLNRCDFAGGSVSFDIKSIGGSNESFDLIQLMTNDMTFNDVDAINYKIKTKDADTNYITGPISVISNDNINLPKRQKVVDVGDITITPTITNISSLTSPMIDLERLNTIIVKNNITSYTTSDTLSESVGGFYEGTASARYITRRVTLNNNFDSSGLTVYLDVNKPSGTSIEVYYKVLNGVDQNNFDEQPYVKMNPIFVPGVGQALISTTAKSWTSETYQALNISYEDITTGSLYDTFKVFAIKICMYSDNPAIVPQIKNFRAIATA